MWNFQSGISTRSGYRGSFQTQGIFFWSHYSKFVYPKNTFSHPKKTLGLEDPLVWIPFPQWKPGLSRGGGQNLKQRNIEQPIFQNFKITNIKITKDELFDSFIFEFISPLFINYLHNLIIFQGGKYSFSKWQKWLFLNFSNCNI